MRFTEAQIADMKSRGAVVREHGVNPSPELSKALRLLLDKKPKVKDKTVSVAQVSGNPCQSIWIPGWFPGLLNQWDGHHWSRRAKIKKADREIVRFYFEAARLQRTTEPRRVSFLFVMAKGQRMFDRDAARKSANDALVACGALFDDTPKFCYEGPVSYARALLECQAGTLLMLEDCG